VSSRLLLLLLAVPRLVQVEAVGHQVVTAGHQAAARLLAQHHPVALRPRLRPVVLLAMVNHLPTTKNQRPATPIRTQVQPAAVAAANLLRRTRRHHLRLQRQLSPRNPVRPLHPVVDRLVASRPRPVVLLAMVNHLLPTTKNQRPTIPIRTPVQPAAAAAVNLLRRTRPHLHHLQTAGRPVQQLNPRNPARPLHPVVVAAAAAVTVAAEVESSARLPSLRIPDRLATKRLPRLRINHHLHPDLPAQEALPQTLRNLLSHPLLLKGPAAPMPAPALPVMLTSAKTDMLLLPLKLVQNRSL